MAYENLFRPVRIGTLEVPNRVAMMPMGTGYGDARGGVTEKLIAYHAERARAGIGYNSTEHIAVLPEGRLDGGMLCLYDDSYIEGFARLCAAVHREGGRIVFQLNHAGRRCLAELAPGRAVVGVTDVPQPGPGFKVPRPLTPDDMEEIAEAWVQAAGRARTAGADGVEVHMAHGYLLSDFLNSAVNTRQDEYGGDLNGRMRFPLQVLRRVRTAVGPDYPVICRLSAEGSPWTGFDLDTCRRIARRLEECGADTISISALAPWSIGSYYLERGATSGPAAAVKQVVRVPVIAVNRIVRPEQAERMLTEGRCDIIGLGRALLADPHWLAKAREGREEEIIPCIACNIGCLSRRPTGGREVACTANPRTGREYAWPAERAARPKKVWVVGAGPAGVSAALEAEARGHDVTLFDRASRIGGAFVTAAVPPGKGELRELIHYWEEELKRRGIATRLGAEVSAAVVASARPDVAIVATGAEQRLPPEHAGGPVPSVTAEALLAGRAEAGTRVLVVGGGSVGLETADYLSSRGKHVTVVEILAAVGADLARGVKEPLLDRLAQAGVEILTESTLIEARQGGVLLRRGGATLTREVDTIVWATGFASRRELADALAGRGLEVKVIGDAHQPRTALEATAEGALAAREL
jgi:2,4-dienoyl-CoA reductase-like NADH-dependent reductase (Old Yellow Enzyme family)/thioredoxin reductase